MLSRPLMNLFTLNINKMETTKNNSTFIPNLIVSLVIVLATGILSASADETVDHKAVHAEVKAAVAANDYDAWASAVEDTKFAEKHADKINEDTFNKLVEAYSLREAGDKEGAKAIMQELGIKKHKGHKNKVRLTDEQKETIQAAMSEGYDAWAEAVGSIKEDAKILNVINEGNFDRLVALHEAREAGDRETVKEIKEELGLKRYKRK